MNFSRNARLLAPACGTDAPDVGAPLVDRLVRVAELARLDRAAGRVVLRVEVEDRPPAGLVRQAMNGAGFVCEGDLRGRVADGGNAHGESVAGVSMTRIAPRPQGERCVGRATDVRKAPSRTERERFVSERVVEPGGRDPLGVAAERDQRDEIPDAAIAGS